MLIEILPLLTLGFGLGLLHALDADHIMAVSALSNQRPSFRRTMIQSSNWALGHGFVLLVCGVLLFGFGLALPEFLQKAAEISVGVLLIALGGFCFYQIRRDRLVLERHSHGDVEHVHWTHASKEKHQGHKPVFVGVLHGLAGSAPALALIPAVASGEVAEAMGYLVLFSIGVMLAMMTFGFGFAHIQRFLSSKSQNVFQFSRQLVAFVSMTFGGYWIFQAI